MNAAPKLDPKPWKLYELRFAKQAQFNDDLATFDPQPEYSQNLADYSPKDMNNDRS